MIKDTFFIIMDFTLDPIYKLRSSIPLGMLNWCWLSYNPNAIQILEKNLDKVHWGWLSMNPNAIQILENNLDKVSGFDEFSYIHRDFYDKQLICSAERTTNLL